MDDEKLINWLGLSPCLFPEKHKVLFGKNLLDVLFRDDRLELDLGSWEEKTEAL